jgi:hypothetical protein
MITSLSGFEWLQKICVKIKNKFTFFNQLEGFSFRSNVNDGSFKKKGRLFGQPFLFMVFQMIVYGKVISPA